MAGAGLLNIGASNKDDAFYRYKMPRLQTKIEGRGNGIKTNLVNMVDVAKALARPPSYTTKFFGCELGAQSKFDEKTGTSIVNGAHDNTKLAALLENFIKKYVQCYGCGNPETDILITKAETITLKCAACGFISDVDMRDKLTTFILKNPPEQKKSGKDKKLRRAEKERLQEGEAADEENKKVKKEGRKKKGHDEEKKSSRRKKTTDEEEEVSPPASPVDEDEDVDEDDDGVQWLADTSQEAAQKRIQEQLTSVTTEMVMPVESPRTKSKPKKLPSAKVKDADLPKFEELSLHDKLVKELKEELGKGSSASKMTEVLESKGGEEPQEVMSSYFEALFSDGVAKEMHKNVVKKQAYLKQAVHDEESQKQLLVAIEMFCSTGPDRCKQVALVLKELYDEDILEEENIMAWFKAKPSAPAKSEDVRKYAKPFIEWLENAESEEEDEEDE